MSSTKIQEAKLNLTQSAFDFLERSVNEIKDHPKYAVIHFATAVELLLKARLMREHWSLAVEQVSKAEVNEFLQGRCKTVAPAEAVKRLSKICGENISADAANQFGKLSAHRNRMIHFYHEAGAEDASPELIQEIVKEQCLTWYFLERLLGQWGDQFDEFDEQIKQTHWRMRKLREFLQVAFDQLKPQIDAEKKAGAVFKECSGCGCESAKLSEETDVLYEKHCLVCNLTERFLEIPCPEECGKTVHVEEGQHGEKFHCVGCGCELTKDDFESVLDTGVYDPAEYVQMNCAHCMSLGSVVEHHDRYICLECFSVEDEIAGCGWCNELQIGGGDLEYSYHSGCEFCDGHAGWTKDD